MSNDKEANVYERLWKLYVMIGKMIMDGVRDPQKVAEVLQSIVSEKVGEAKVYLRWISVTPLAATVPESLESAREVFKTRFDANFEKWGVDFSETALAMDISGDELVHDGKFYEFLGNTAEELERRRVLGSQLVKFCREHSDDKDDTLRKGGIANFFVLTKGKSQPVKKDLSNVLVASVFIYGVDNLTVSLYRFNSSVFWGSANRQRTFSPQP